MLNEKQIREIQEYLEKSVNPLFFFDNDLDGMASFLLLSRKYCKGKGVAIKTSPDLNESYLRKINELNPDSIFILDKPLISKKFYEGVKEMNLPIIWIDHHQVDHPVLGLEKLPEDIFYYNSKNNNPESNEPTTYLCYQIAKNKEDLWIAIIGCISDNYLPVFIKEFKEMFPELVDKTESAFQILYESDIGKIARICSFGLKDRTSNVVKMIKFMQKVSSPKEVLDDNSQLMTRFEQIEKKFKKLVDKAKDFARGKILYFQYGGDLSLSADIANELSYKYIDKIIIVAYISGIKANVSIRGKKIKEITLRSLEGLEATGGGHEDATGAKLNASDLPIFKERFEKFIKERI